MIDSPRLLAETIQFTPEQERALFAAFLVFLAIAALAVGAFVLSVVCGFRSGRDPGKAAAFSYWLTWMAIEATIAVAGMVSREAVWLELAGAMAAFTGGGYLLGRLVRRGRSTPAVSRPVPPDRGAPGSRP